MTSKWIGNKITDLSHSYHYKQNNANIIFHEEKSMPPFKKKHWENYTNVNVKMSAEIISLLHFFIFVFTCFLSSLINFQLCNLFKNVFEIFAKVNYITIIRSWCGECQSNNTHLTMAYTIYLQYYLVEFSSNVFIGNLRLPPNSDRWFSDRYNEIFLYL